MAEQRGENVDGARENGRNGGPEREHIKRTNNLEESGAKYYKITDMFQSKGHGKCL